MNLYWHVIRFRCESLNFYRVPANRYIQSTCATTGEGLYEGLDWLSSNIASKVYLIYDVHVPVSNIAFQLQLYYVINLEIIQVFGHFVWNSSSDFSIGLIHFLVFRLEARLSISTANWLGAPDVSWKLRTESPLQPVRCLLPARYIFCLEYVMMSLSNVCSTLLYCWMFFGLVHFAQGLEFQYHDTLGTYYILHSYTWLVVAKELPYHVTCECRSGFLWDLVQQSKLFHPEVKVCS